IKSFSIGFAEQDFNEIRFARIAAHAFRVEHHEHFVTPAEVLEALPVLLAAFDEPFANASAVPAYFCAKLAREHGVDRLFAGDGGDELFAGNERYAVQRLFDDYFRIPAFVRTGVLEPLVAAMDRGTGVFGRARKYIQRANTPYPERLDMYGFLEEIPMDALFAGEFLEELEGSYDPGSAGHAHYRRARARTELDRQLYVDLKITISDNDLIKVTRSAQAAGVAARFPFLDHHLAEFAATVPAALKMRGRELRTFFKRAYRDLLPRETRMKRKHGFGLPIPVWLRTDRKLNEAMRDLVLSPGGVARGYFRPGALEEIVRRHTGDQTSFYGTLLWNLMTLELWHRGCDEGFR
ncbi:MAG: asparagine synthase, partial [Candidatus Latescibacteria bacterium]|nr:asparagine synthase [Candidatus Latescibacterota bacterium]